jgi:crotonobetaine/carnitine-CoA ligase
MSVEQLPIEEMTLGRLLRSRAAQLGEKPYLLFGGESHSYAEALAATEAAAAKLLGLGVGPGDRVGLMLDNHPDHLWLVWACGLIGAVAVPINTATKGAQLSYFLADAEPEVVVVQDNLAGRMRLEQKPRAQVVVYGDWDEADDPGLGWLAYADLKGSAEALAAAPQPRFSDLLLIMYTSGTTGPSKGVMCPHAHPLHVARYVAEGFELGEQDRMYVCQPLFHSAALWWGSLGSLWAGATLALAPRFSASGFWRDVNEYEATWFIAVMSMVGILQKREVSAQERSNPARQGFIIPVPEARREYEQRTGITITTNYAMTEIHPVALLGPHDGGYDKPGTAGRVCAHDEVRIVDDDDLEVPAGTVGEIALRPRDPWSIFRGYWRKPEATAEAFVNAWFHTGDLASVDEDGFLFFKGRKKDAIRRRGENISAQEVEQGVLVNEGVRECAVAGIESELGEQDVAAFVVRRDPELSAAAVVEHAAENMAYYMVPRYVCFLDELPQTESFKIKKYELLRYAAEHPERLWDREREGITVDRDGVRAR